jgi:hypothetical protein
VVMVEGDLFLRVCVCVCVWYWGLNSGPTLKPLYQPFLCVCVMDFFKIGSLKLFAWTGFKP